MPIHLSSSHLLNLVGDKEALNYSKIYNDLVAKAKVRGLNKKVLDGYFEKHHIVPKCLGGSEDSDNFVLFTAREHYVAHLLLWKLNPKSVGLFTAAFFMSKKRLFKFNSKLYEVLKEKHSEELKEFNKANSGFKSPAFKNLVGEVRGKLTVIAFDGWRPQSTGANTSHWLCSCECGNTTVLAAKFLTKKSGTRSCGCARTEKMKAFSGENNPFFGKTHSQEVKDKLSKQRMGISVNKGAIRTEENRKKISESLRARNRPAWEAGTVITKPEQLQKWLMADYYHELYLTNPELTSAKFATLYNRLHNDSLPANAFASMHREFVKGWIPLEDKRWIKFSKGG